MGPLRAAALGCFMTIRWVEGSSVLDHAACTLNIYHGSATAHFWPKYETDVLTPATGHCPCVGCLPDKAVLPCSLLLQCGSVQKADLKETIQI